MIWDPDNRLKTAASPVVSHITAEIAEVCGDDMAMDPSKVEELAKAVESFLDREHAGDAPDSRYVVMLASRALTSIGEGTAGRRLLVFGTGLVKPSEWEVTSDDEVWVLDLKEMVLSQDSPLELIFFGSLSIVIESIAEIWDRGNGRGVIGLKNVFSTAVALLGSECADKNAALLVDEIRLVCEKKLAQLREERHWEHIPRVMNLDI